MVRYLATTITVALWLTGCASEPKIIEVVRTVKVEIPVPVEVIPPVVLSTPFSAVAPPMFVSPSDPAASSALTASGERQIKQLVFDLYKRVRGWEAWARELRPP